MVRNGNANLEAIVISSAEPPSLLKATRQKYFTLDDGKLLEHLDGLGGMYVSDPRRRELLTHALPLIRSAYRLHRSYQPDPDVSTDVPLHICSGIDEPLGDERLRRWRHHSSAPVTFHEYLGGHFYWHSDLAGITDTFRGVFVARHAPELTTDGEVAECPR